MRMYSKEIWKALACPYCGSGLQRRVNGAYCDSCQTLYTYSDCGSLDLRLKRSKVHKLEFQINDKLSLPCDDNFKKLPMNPNPEEDFSDVPVPWHLSKELLSHFPKAKRGNSLMVDLGCGSAIHRGICELLEYEYIGLDYNSEEASILGDAHALPFKDESIEFLLSIAVIEHIKFPHVMMHEVYRVLEQDGLFVGTVAFLEPYHGFSYYHHSHLGLHTSLCNSGFDVKYISPSEKWTGFRAQISMGLFPKMPRIISTALIWPLETLHKIWWRMGRLINPEINAIKRLLTNTGSFSFVARKGWAPKASLSKGQKKNGKNISA